MSLNWAFEEEGGRAEKVEKLIDELRLTVIRPTSFSFLSSSIQDVILISIFVYGTTFFPAIIEAA